MLFTFRFGVIVIGVTVFLCTFFAVAVGGNVRAVLCARKRKELICVKRKREKLTMETCAISLQAIKEGCVWVGVFDYKLFVYFQREFLRFFFLCSRVSKYYTNIPQLK